MVGWGARRSRIESGFAGRSSDCSTSTRVGLEAVLATYVGYAAGNGQSLYRDQTRCLGCIYILFVDVKAPRLHGTSIRLTCYVRRATDLYRCGNGGYTVGVCGVGLDVIDELVEVRTDTGSFRKA